MTETPRALKPADASAAIILLPDRRYLLQHRDDRPDIFFPGHWGFFGGALEPGETPRQALHREVREELGLTLRPDQAAFFTKMDLDFSCVGGWPVVRHFFEVRLDADQAAGVTLGEGQDARGVAGEEALDTLRFAPYDGFGLWLHVQARKIRGA